MAFDIGRGEMVLFGGLGGGGPLADTWVWDGTSWAQRTPATSPPARSEATMAYDVHRAETVLFGGASGGLLGDTWIWDGNGWTQRSPASSPPGIWQSAMAYDVLREETVLFDFNGDTWTWDGVTWAQHTPAIRPAARWQAAMTYDPVRGETILFGGWGDGTLSETWSWNGIAWVRHVPAATGPAPQTSAVLAFATTAAAGPVLFDVFGDTWIYAFGGAGPEVSVTPSPFPSVAPSATVSPLPLPTLEPATGYLSDDCVAGTAVVEGFASGTYVRVRTMRADPRTTWVCVRADGPSVNLGGKFAVTDPVAVAPGLPAADERHTACSGSGNTIPGQHPVFAGAVGDPGDPATYLPFIVDAYAAPGQAWLCVGVGGARHRVLVPVSASATPPTVTFAPDLPGSHMPVAPTTTAPSGTCQAGAGESGRLLNATAGDARAWLYQWRPTPTVVKVCVRAEGPANAGGVLTVDTTATGGALPGVDTSATEMTGCGLDVVRLASPVLVEVRRSASLTPPVSICVAVGSAALRVTVTAGSGQQPATVTWSPDPGTPG